MLQAGTEGESSRKEAELNIVFVIIVFAFVLSVLAVAGVSMVKTNPLGRHHD